MPEQADSDTIEILLPDADQKSLEPLVRKLPENTGAVFSDSVSESLQDSLQLVRDFERLVGIVDTDTRTERLMFEVIFERDIEEGRLVETVIGEKKVLYQVIDGLTREDIIYEKNS